MASDPGSDACPLCGGGEEQAALTAGPARVTLRKRDLSADAVARVGLGDEPAALRESVAWHQSGMEDLQEELEAERGAAAEAASEAMSMILRLQRDKSEAMMEARQFRRFAEDRFAHDAAEVAALQDAIARRDASIQSLSAQLRACRSRLLQLGFLSPSSLPSSPTAAAAGDHPSADDECLDDHPAPSDVGTPRTHHLLNRMPGRAADKGVICTRPRHARALSNDSLFGGTTVTDEFPFVVEQDELPKCGHFEWLDEYIERIGMEVASRELENPSVVEQLGCGNPISAGTTVDAEVKAELKKMNKQLRQIIELKKQDNLMAGNQQHYAILTGCRYVLARASSNTGDLFLSPEPISTPRASIALHWFLHNPAPPSPTLSDVKRAYRANNEIEGEIQSKQTSVRTLSSGSKQGV
uniref:Uncharacterized protein n=1 Tax=Avena sativa TaxID=4498 RepID=A0ACD6AW12_AVESA